MEIDLVSPKKCEVRRKGHFDENDDESSQLAEESLRVHYTI